MSCYSLARCGLLFCKLGYNPMSEVCANLLQVRISCVGRPLATGVRRVWRSTSTLECWTRNPADIKLGPVFARFYDCDREDGHVPHLGR